MALFGQSVPLFVTLEKITCSLELASSLIMHEFYEKFDTFWPIVAFFVTMAKITCSLELVSSPKCMNSFEWPHSQNSPKYIPIHTKTRIRHHISNTELILLVKFIFSKKATKIEKIYTVFLKKCQNRRWRFRQFLRPSLKTWTLDKTFLKFS